MRSPFSFVPGLSRHLLFVAKPFFGLILLVISSGIVVAQGSPGEWAWKPIAVKDGLTISYILYALDSGDGVVIKLGNSLEDSSEFSFELIFRADGQDDRTYPVRGVLGPREIRTGESDGLYFRPFEAGFGVREIAVRKLLFPKKPVKQNGG